MISLLQDYVSVLQRAELSPSERDGEHSYYMPSDTVSPRDWKDFVNVYQVHCPKIFMNGATRDVNLLLPVVIHIH